MSNRKVCIIPARSGSQRIPHKNIRKFNGKPMIAWAIEIAQNSQLFDEIIVSTDSAEYADIAKTFGASIPFLRPSSLSDEYTSTNSVIVHAINFLLERDIHFPITCCMYPTAALALPSDLITANNLLSMTTNQYIFPAARLPVPLEKLFLLDDNIVNKPGFSKLNTRSQDLSHLFYDTGQFYYAWSHTWITQPDILANGRAILVPSLRAQDIDTEEDWQRAELLHSHLSGA